MRLEFQYNLGEDATQQDTMHQELPKTHTMQHYYAGVLHGAKHRKHISLCMIEGIGI